MKKNLFKVLFGLSIFAVGLNVHAAKAPTIGGVTLDDLENGVGETNGTVVVGEVATPVYTVNIIWDDLTFDWTYDKTTEEFSWKPASLCEREYEMVEDPEFQEKLENGKIFTNNTCTDVTYERTDDAVYYSVYDRDYSSVMIEDLSENGKIVPSIRWNSTDEYSYTDAKFVVRDKVCISVDREDVYNAVLDYGTGLYSNNTCSTKVEGTGFEAGKYYAVVRTDEGSELKTEEIPDSVRESGAGSGTYIEDLGLHIGRPAFDENSYFVKFSLDTNETPTTTPTVGDEIGTITISIKAK